MRATKLLAAIVGMVATVSLVFAGLAAADGTEDLGAPSIAIAEGSGAVAAGTGTASQPAAISIDVPAGASVVQVLAYWNGFHSQAAVGADDTISIGGSPVTGTLIGGPRFFFNGALGQYYSSTYRADITGLGLVGAGANSIGVDGMDFDRVDNGAGLLVIYDDGSEADIELVDGQDLAFVNFAPPLDTTVPQTLVFPAEPVDRVATLSMFFASVEGPDRPGPRPTTIEITVDGVVTQVANALASADGDEWDTLTVDVSIPAGVGAVTVQALSADVAGTGALPASFAWTMAALTVPVTPPAGGGEGCTPGFWKQEHHLDSWVGYSPTDDYEAVFGVDADFGPITLLGALEQGGGRDKALGRHSVAALLNAANPDVSYEFTPAEVIALVQDAYASGDFNGVKDVLEGANESGCPLS